MKTPTKITWTVIRLGERGDEWTATDEHGQKHGRVCRADSGRWFYTAWMAFCAGETRRKRGAMHIAEQVILRDWPTEVEV